MTSYLDVDAEQARLLKLADDNMEVFDAFSDLVDTRLNNDISEVRLSHMAGESAGWAHRLETFGGVTLADFVNYATALDIRINITLEDA